MSKITKKGAAWRLLVAAGTAALALGTGTSAQAASTGKSLSTSFTVVNLSVDEATVAASYYKEGSAVGAGGEAWTADGANTSFKLPGNGGQKIVRQYTDGALTAGRGGVILSSDKPLGAIVQITVRTANTAATSGAYSAISTASDTFFVPLVSRRGGSASGKTNSQIIIQNANTTGPANVTVTFNPSGFVKNLTVAPGASYYYDLDDEAGLSENYFGAAVVSAGSGGQIVVVSNFFTGDDGLQTFNAFPASSVGTKWLIPLFISRIPNGLNSPVAIQNLSGADMAVGSVTMNCIGDPLYNGGTSAAFSKTNATAVANNAAFYFNPVADATLPDNWVGACSVTAPGNVVSFVQLRTVGGTGNPGNAAAHEAINASGTNKRVFVPLVAKRLANGFATAVTIQNLSAGTATVNLTYKPSADFVAAGGSAADIVVGPYTIAAGGSLIQNHRNPGNGGSGTNIHNLPDAWFGTLVVTSDQPIDGFVQLTNVGVPSPAGDTFMAHNVFTQP